MSEYCKYYKMKKQVSLDSGNTWSDVKPLEYKRGDLYEINSVSCGATTGITRNVYLDPFEDYYCSGTTKYYKIEKQISYDSGNTWYGLEPSEAEIGPVFEYDSSDCGGSPSTSGEYLTFIALEEEEEFRFDATYETSGNVQYSLDSGNTWLTYNASSLKQSPPKINSGETIMWRAKNLTVGVSYISATHPGMGTFREMHGKKFNVRGNILSMSTNRTSYYFDIPEKERPNFPAAGAYMLLFKDASVVDASKLYLPRIAEFECYRYMFKGCTLLEYPPKLSIPFLGETISDGCFQGMFADCSSLKQAPLLPAITLSKDCYAEIFANCTSLIASPIINGVALKRGCFKSMFEGCASLIVPPVLPYTKTEYECYFRMFANCTSLTTSPDLPAEILEQYAYWEMFKDANNLNYVSSNLMQSASDTSNYKKNWLAGVSNTGTFKKKSGSEWSRGASGIPVGWTVLTD